tara:strand:+ start:222 stop:437 length:216 start_codon:yes stop_codon:yes gene_type:complete
LIKESELVDKHLNQIHTIINNGDNVKDDIINELVNSLEGLRDCINEIELGINSNYQLNVKSNNYEYDDESK